ncbi:MAG: type IV toxin-antitoxin system AbiEi family antitoxin domain-containing protein [Myxococcaceae bacterium]|nr:type IV toxin-antitoxin system AbiEi family antitoxin domain-containing protein [Myxococcaceae bacterium]
MPRYSPTGDVPGWGELYQVAEGQGGYFTARQAAEHHISRQLLRYSVNAGHLERAGRAVFRLRRYPPSAREELVLLWLWARGEGVFSHETALSLSTACPTRSPWPWT